MVKLNIFWTPEYIRVLCIHTSFAVGYLGPSEFPRDAHRQVSDRDKEAASRCAQNPCCLGPKYLDSGCPWYTHCRLCFVVNRFSHTLVHSQKVKVKIKAGCQCLISSRVMRTRSLWLRSTHRGRGLGWQLRGCCLQPRQHCSLTAGWAGGRWGLRGAQRWARLLGF